MIAIIEGCGANLASIQFSLTRLGRKFCLTRDPAKVQSASHVILPGVGTANRAMAQLKEMQLVDVIRQLQQPVLGICLGMQILYEWSDEGKVSGLNLLSGKIKRIANAGTLPVPHMGWNQLMIQASDAPLLKGINNENYFYYVHSFIAPVNQHTLAITQYGRPFSAIVNYKNFFGVQFHPERSGTVGEKILNNFLNLES